MYYPQGDRASGRDYVRNKLCLLLVVPPDFRKTTYFYEFCVELFENMVNTHKKKDHLAVVLEICYGSP